MRTAKPHGARRRLERGKVDFARLGGGDDSADVARRDSHARHHDDAVPCAHNELDDERQPVENARLLA